MAATAVMVVVAATPTAATAVMVVVAAITAAAATAAAMVAAAAVASASGWAAVSGGGVAAAGAEATGAGGTAIGTGAVGSSLLCSAGVGFEVFNVLSAPSGLGRSRPCGGFLFAAGPKKKPSLRGPLCVGRTQRRRAVVFPGTSPYHIYCIRSPNPESTQKE
jgi:hypothetical protein